jgi:hypothetical protein
LEGGKFPIHNQDYSTARPCLELRMHIPPNNSTPSSQLLHWNVYDHFKTCNYKNLEVQYTSKECELRNQNAWSQILALPLPNQVILDKYFFVPQFSQITSIKLLWGLEQCLGCNNHSINNYLQSFQPNFTWKTKNMQNNCLTCISIIAIYIAEMP